MRRSILLFALLLVGCGSEIESTPSTDAGADSPADSGGKKACVDGATSHAHGTTWACSDGCNTCSCSDGMISSTTMACGCNDAKGFHATGTTWTCPDGCNTCTCNKDRTISATAMACEAGYFDAGSD